MPLSEKSTNSHISFSIFPFYSFAARSGSFIAIRHRFAYASSERAGVVAAWTQLGSTPIRKRARAAVGEESRPFLYKWSARIHAVSTLSCFGILHFLQLRRFAFSNSKLWLCGVLARRKSLACFLGRWYQARCSNLVATWMVITSCGYERARIRHWLETRLCGSRS